jgi:hypothetical protein
LQVIEDQMKFRSFIMLKMFISATATGLLSLGAMHLIPATRSIVKGLLDDYKAYDDRRGFTSTRFHLFGPFVPTAQLFNHPILNCLLTIRSIETP